jgi:hypothetical protein
VRNVGPLLDWAGAHLPVLAFSVLMIVLYALAAKFGSRRRRCPVCEARCKADGHGRLEWHWTGNSSRRSRQVTRCEGSRTVGLRGSA